MRTYVGENLVKLLSTNLVSEGRERTSSRVSKSHLNLNRHSQSRLVILFVRIMAREGI